MAHALRRPMRTSGAGRSRTGMAAARGASALGALLVALARVVRVVTYLAALVIVVAIVLRIAGANPANAIVRDIHDVGKALVGPFHNVFTIKNPKASIAANWGLAAVVWVIVGSVISSLLVRIAPRRV